MPSQIRVEEDLGSPVSNALVFVLVWTAWTAHNTLNYYTTRQVLVKCKGLEAMGPLIAKLNELATP